MTELHDASFSARSFINPGQPDSWCEVAGSSLAASFPGGVEQLKRAALIDLSSVPRTGFRGTAAAEHLASQGQAVPERPNQALASASGELTLRLSQKEFWLLGSLADQGGKVEQVEAAQVPEQNCYSLFCRDSHAWMLLTGAHLSEIMAKVCGVDLRPEAFPVGSIAQTSVARVNAIVVNQPVAGIPAFSILCDSASAQYFWEAMLDAMLEFGGAAAGIEQLPA